MKVIYQKLRFRIIEVIDECTTFEDLIGDCYSPDANPDIDKETLASDLRKFMRRYDSECVYGYELQEWNSEIDGGWTHLDSCYGFLGQYQKNAESYDHYIIQEYIDQINNVKGERAQ